MGALVVGFGSFRPRPGLRAGRLAVCALLVALGCDFLDPASEPYRAGQRAFAAGDHEAARAHWERAAQLDSPLAKKNLGDLHAYGLGVAQHDGLAVSWYREAAEQGLAEAQYALARMLEAGRGAEADLTAAVALYREAALGGCPEAQARLGLLYERGEALTRDDALAAKWYRRAARSGDARGMAGLAYLYASGRGVDKDPIRAFELNLAAAEGGSARAQHSLSAAYASGLGVERSAEQAVYWLRRAAGQGDPRAQYALGRRCAEGDGVSVDHAEAVRWYRAAAERGHVDAQLELGIAYASGTGVALDLSQAIYWLTGAADQGSEIARLRLGYVLNDRDRARARRAYSPPSRRYTSEDDMRPRRTASRQSAQRRNRPGRCRVADSVLLIHRLDCMNKGGVFVESREGAGGFGEVEGSYDPDEWEWVWE